MLTTDMFLGAGAISNAPTINTPPVTSSAISHFRTYLKIVYKRSSISPDKKWPPTPSKKYISLTVVEDHYHICRDDYIGHTLQGRIADVASTRKEIAIEQILEAEGQEKLNLVLVEGAPGIGKSTLAWELCRKWEEFSCMQKYGLVILLRLREEEARRIANINQLFFSHDGETIAREVSANHGRGTLFILDGFDELPKPLQQEGFLLNLIQGRVLPESTVLVTSRPSATGELLTSCRPLIQKRVEVLGFTQDSVEEYAESIFSPETEKLKKFNAYISASKNPAINSLMYVPLNAAIIVEIYCSCKSEHLLPHTLTELYTQLCLTILNRHLMAQNPPVRVGKFEELPPDLYQQFLYLPKIAFEGFKKEEIIFHAVPPDLHAVLIRFGFLDSVSALYGGGGISYNFLHLTIQEFFAAYHVSHLGRNGLEVFLQYGKVQRWNTVWRFVAGLTKFRYYEGHIDRHVFIDELSYKSQFSILFPQCLFEAHSAEYFSSVLKTSTSAGVIARYPTALDVYALGYCIANFAIGVPWDVEIDGGDHHGFTCGLNTKVSSEGCINRLCFWECNPVHFTDLKSPPHHRITALTMWSCRLTDTDMVHLSELIPHLPCLEELDFCINSYIVEDVQQDGLLKVLHQLYNSNVTSLSIYRTGLAKYSHDHFTALKYLICPPSGKLKHLVLDDYDVANNKTVDLLSAPSSLKSLVLDTDEIPLHALHLKNNTRITRLTLRSRCLPADHIAALIDIVNHNTILEKLSLDGINVEDIDALRRLVSALHENSSLQIIELWITISGIDNNDGAVTNYMKTHHKELTLDSRIEYKMASWSYQSSWPVW